MNTDIIGASPNRTGGYARVTGHQEYLADLKMKDALHVKLVKLKCARARIISIDTSEAEKVPGVAFVMTAADLPQPVPLFGPQFKDRPPLAVTETKFHGEPVAAVAAETKEAAELAASLVVVEHEVLDNGVFSVADALDASKPLVQDPGLRPDDPLAETNMRTEHLFGWGDVASVEADAHLVLDHNYQFPMVTHFAIEPHGYMAAPDGTGIIVWSTVQHPFWLQKTLADLLDLPLSKVRVIAPDLGGGFGGKQQPKYEPLIAYMAHEGGSPGPADPDPGRDLPGRQTGCPRCSGQDRFQPGRHPPLRGLRVQLPGWRLRGHRRSSRDQEQLPGSRALSGAAREDRGASAAIAHRAQHGVPWLRAASDRLGSRAEHRRRCPRVGHRSRGDSASQPARVSRGFRPQRTTGQGRRTLARDGGEGSRADRLGLPGARRPRDGGIAIGAKSGPTTGLSYSTVRLLADGSAIVFSGTSDMGQGARTVFAQIAANELGVAMEDIAVVMGDTATVPYDQQTSASRSTVLMGNAVYKACQDILEQVEDIAATHYDVDRSDVGASDGIVKVGDRKFTVAEVAQAGLGALGGETDRQRRGAQGQGARPSAWREPRHSSSSTPRPVEVEVDRDTGEIIIHKYVSVGRRGQGPQPGSGARPGRRRRDPGPRTHADGALHHGRGADPEPRCTRLPGADQQGPAASR